MDYEQEIRQLSKAAEGGDTVAGEKLLNLFSELATDPADYHPELVRHVARCVKRFMALEPEKRRDGARRAFCVQRPPHRSPQFKPNEHHVKAMATFYLARAQGISFEEAKVKGASAGCISPETMHDLTRFKKKTVQAWCESMAGLCHLTKEEREALMAKTLATSSP
jgi:hypothetical protein